MVVPLVIVDVKNYFEIFREKNLVSVGLETKYNSSTRHRIIGCSQLVVYFKMSERIFTGLIIQEFYTHSNCKELFLLKSVHRKCVVNVHKSTKASMEK